MTPPEPTEDVHLLLGSYVLGGLSVQDRRRFDDHLPGCARCRHELAEAAPLPALLRRVPGVPTVSVPALALQPDGVEASLGALLATVRARRSRRHTARWVAAAAAVLIAFAGGVGVATLAHQQPAQVSIASTVIARTVALSSTSGEVTGQAGLTTKAWGTAISLKLEYLPTAGVFTLWATDDSGHTELAATWGATPSGACVVNGATSIATAHLARLQVVGPADAVVAQG